MREENDVIPAKDADFDLFFANLQKYCTEKCTAAPPSTQAAWTHIPSTATTELTELFNKWNAAFSKAKGQRSPADTLAKTEARDKAEKFLRVFIQKYLKWEEVSDEERVEMGLHNRDRIPTHHGAPEDYVEVALSNAPTGPTHIADYHIKGKSRRGKHPYRLAEVQTALRAKGDPLPTADSDEGWGLSEISMDSPFTKHWKDEDAGKIACYRFRWEASNGLKGPWTMATARVP